MTSEGVPIVIVHCGTQGTPGVPNYLGLALLQAVRLHEVPIYLVTDAPGCQVDGVEFVPYSAFEMTTREFRDMYFHLSKQPFDSERLCIERWFVIRDLMRSRKLERIFCMDSDVLLFCSVPELAKRFADVDYAILNGTSWGTTFINQRQVLEDFCDYVTKAYHRDPDVWPEVDREIGFSKPYHHWLNLTDMGFIDLFSRRFAGKYRIREQAQIMDGSLIDPNFTVATPGLEMDGEFKKVVWIGGFPHGIIAHSGKPVRFDLIHFQGIYAKGLMQQFFNRFTPTWEKLLAATVPASSASTDSLAPK